MNLKQKMRAEGYRTVAEVASATGFSKDSVRRWVRGGLLRYTRVGAGGRDTPSIYIDGESVVEHLGEDFREKLGMTLFWCGDPHTREFETEREADAFMMGVRYANSRVLDPVPYTFMVRQVDGLVLVRVRKGEQ